MSDSEDDFMSDKYLVAASAQAEPPPSSSTTYSARRSAAALRSMRAGQAKNMVSARQTEEHRRRQGLATSLFDEPRSGAGTPQDDRERRQPGGSGGGAKAMEMMMKMGWKVGQGLGRKRSPSPDSSSKLPKADHHAELDSEPSRRGIGSSSKQPARTEPIRISLWSGRRGISARSPSPPPLPDPSGPSPDSLDPKKLERLGKETEDFRARQRREFGEKEAERKSSKARDMLVRFDEERGVKVGVPRPPPLSRPLTDISFTLYTSSLPIHSPLSRDRSSSSSTHLKPSPRLRLLVPHPPSPLRPRNELQMSLQRRDCVNRCGGICCNKSRVKMICWCWETRRSGSQRSRNKVSRVKGKVRWQWIGRRWFLAPSGY